MSERVKITKIGSFTGDYAWLSNFWYADIIFEDDMYDSLEKAYVAAKTTDLVLRNKIRIAKTPGAAKRMGRELELREGWEGMKLSIMEQLIKEKFTRNLDLTQRLIDTDGAELVEGNGWHDNFFGNCSCEKCKSITGENHLGRIIMKVRKGLLRR